MNIVNITLGVDTQPCSSITLGRRGENEVTQVVVDFSSWVEEFGAGVITLLAMRSQDTSAYPVVLTLSSNTATWDVTSTDTAFKGSGRAEFIYTIGEQIAKSVVFNTVVMQDIGEPSETPPDPYEDWLERLTELGAETQANAEAAEQSAEDAAESAEDAAQSATSAEGYAGQAETAAGLAQDAQTASEAARDAAQAAQASAEASATAASGSAASAAGSATAAAGSASDASASATAAGASATTASTAATQAEAAKTAAQAAQSAAEDAAEDAQQAAQQAHVEYEQLSGEVDDLTDEVSQQKSAIEDLEALTNRKAGIIRDTASGPVASFVPDATVPNLLGLTVDIEPVQAGNGDPSPDNVRPISGWDSVEVVADGVNLLPNDYDVYNIGSSYSYLSGVIKNGETAQFVFIDKDTSVDISDCGIGFQTGVSQSHGLPTAFRWAINNGVVQSNKSNVSARGVACDGVMIYPNDQQTFDKLFSRFDIMVVLDSTTTEYHPFAGNTYTITLGQTVYGGTLDATNGTLTVDRAMVDLGTLNWTYDASKERFRGLLPATSSASVSNPDARTHCLCSIYKPSAIAYSDSNRTYMVVCVNTDYVWLRDNRYTDAAAYKAAVSGVQLCYELATPVEITLDPVTIATISGQTNNVWSDAGDVSVEYAADLKAYIDRMNQPTEDDMIANSLIQSGKYFTINNRLFLSTASIAAGAQIIPGHNCTETSLVEALNALNA